MTEFHELCPTSPQAPRRMSLRSSPAVGLCPTWLPTPETVGVAIMAASEPAKCHSATTVGGVTSVEVGLQPWKMSLCCDRCSYAVRARGASVPTRNWLIAFNGSE